MEEVLVVALTAPYNPLGPCVGRPGDPVTSLSYALGPPITALKTNTKKMELSVGALGLGTAIGVCVVAGQLSAASCGEQQLFQGLPPATGLK